MCNGPSLNHVPFDRLANLHVIGLNKVHLLLERQKLDLAFHVAVNPLVIEQAMNDFELLDCPSFLSMAAVSALDRVNTSCNLLSCSTETFGPYFSTNFLDRPIHEGWTVTFVALQLAYLMGFQRIFIVGMDHSFHSHGKANERQFLDQPDLNHFDPRYFSGNNWHLPDLEGSEIAYRLAKFVWERSGREIIDATVNGKCDIFQKMDQEEAFRICKSR